MLKKLSRIITVICFLGVTIAVDTGVVYAAEKLDPFNARFFILPGKDGVSRDIQVSLDFSIHNDAQKKLIGSKFICMEEIDSIRVTDENGARYPFTIKVYPRKRIFWEYPPARDGRRSVKISFIMRDAIKRDGDTYAVTIDWVGGWNRQVLNTAFSFMLPKGIAMDDLVEVSPRGYAFVKSKEGNKIIQKAAVLRTGILKVAFKQKHTALTIKTPPKRAKSDLFLVKNIRVGPHSKSIDRLVFDLNRKIPYSLTTKPDSSEIRVVFNAPLRISPEAVQAPIQTAAIKAVYWDSRKRGKRSCTVKLLQKNLKIKYGALDNPPRFYIDVHTKKEKENAAPTVTARSTPPAKKQVPPAPLPVVAKKKPAEKSAVLQVPVVTEEPLQPLTSTTTTVKASAKTFSVKKDPPVVEKMAYIKAKKLGSRGEHEKAIAALNSVMEQYPETVLKEQILFDIADVYYQLGDEQDKDFFYKAINAYQNAVNTFPDSALTAHAEFSIAECYRKRELFLEARSQYSYFMEKNPDSNHALDARFWMAECLYQMLKFKEAIKEFEEFIYAFPSGSHIREASYRLADCYAQIKDYDRAEYYYERALKRWPDLTKLSKTSLNNMVFTYYYKGEFEKCRNVALISFNIFPSQQNKEELLRYIGDSYQWEGDMEKALKMYGNLVVLFPDTQEGRIGAMRMADLGVNVSGLHAEKFLFKNINPYKEPQKTFTWIVQNETNGELLTEAYYKLGILQAKAGNYPDAIQLFEQSIGYADKNQFHKKSVENIKKILTRMITDAFNNKNYFAVVELFNKNADFYLRAVADWRLFNQIGKSYGELGFSTEAERIFADLCTGEDGSACRNAAALNLGRIALEKKDMEKARKTIAVLLYGDGVDKGQRATAYHMLGDSYFEEQRYNEALDAYSVALKKEDESYRFARTLYRAGESFGELGYYYNGINSLTKFLAIADRLTHDRAEIAALRDDARLLIGDYFSMKKKNDKAIQSYKTLCSTTHNDEKKGLAFVKWGELLVKMKNYDNATRVFSQAVDTMPGNFFNTFSQARIEDIDWVKSMQPELRDFL